MQPEGYYTKRDVWPGPGPWGTERIVVGGPGEVWYTLNHYRTFFEWRGERLVPAPANAAAGGCC